MLHPHQWESSFKAKLADALSIDPTTLRGPNDLGHFDVIATNPPFGSKLPIKDHETLGQFKLGYVWNKTNKGWEQTDQLQNSQPPEILFIERCWQFLKPGGRMAIVLPDAILGAPGLEYLRYWMLTHFRLIASVDLHSDTFQPRNGTQTSVLFLQRKTEQEMQAEAVQGYLFDYEIFMAQINAIGHDKRGNTLYRRNEQGEEILIPIEEDRTEFYEIENHGAVSKRLIRPRKIKDDDTPQVADEFLGWKKETVLGW